MTTNDDYVNLIQDDADVAVVEAMRGLRPKFPAMSFEREAEFLESIAEGLVRADPQKRDALLKRAADLRAHKVTPVAVTLTQQPATKKPALVRY